MNQELLDLLSQVIAGIPFGAITAPACKGSDRVATFDEHGEFVAEVKSFVG